MTPKSLLAPARHAGRQVLRTQSDERLVDLVRAGSDPAFEAIVTRYRRPLTRHCARILPSEDRAEEAVQQSFVRAYEAMRSGDAELALRPWLFRIAHNTALNALRDRGLAHVELDDRADGAELPEEMLERAQGLRRVLAAVQSLPERQRDAILLRELEGRSYEEIAEQLGVSGGAVRQLIHRARNTVREAATAFTPAGFAERIAEAAAPAAAGAAVVKACAAVLVTGAVVSGAAVVPDPQAGTRSHGPGVDAAVAAPAGREAARGAAQPDSRGLRRDPEGVRDRDSGDSSGPGSSESEARSSGSSGSGSSGPGSSGSGSSGSGSSGSGSSGSGSSGSGSSGSGSSGSGSSESGSGGSGSSGSGSSGSGSSGSGSSVSGSSGSVSGDSGSSSSGSGSSGSGISGSSGSASDLVPTDAE